MADIKVTTTVEICSEIDEHILTISKTKEVNGSDNHLWWALKFSSLANALVYEIKEAIISQFGTLNE